MATFISRRFSATAILVLASLIVPPVGVNANPTSENTTDFRAAGCYLPLYAGIVVGINRRTNTVQLPIGRRRGDETARSTAARETLEETGIAVEVGVRLVSVSDATVHIFLCRPKHPVRNYADLRPLDNIEVKEVLVIEPDTLTNFDGRKIDLKWRYDESRLMIKWLDKVIRRNAEEQ